MMSQSQLPVRKADVESGTSRDLYPMMLESPELRWSFIRKVYSIVAIQLLLTVAVGAVVVSYRPIVTFLTTTTGGLACYILLIITPFITLCPLYYYHQRHPINYFLLAIFTASLAFAVGLTCAFTKDMLRFLFCVGKPINRSTLINRIDCSYCLTILIAGKVILEAAILTAVVVVSLTLFTFWAARRGYDFNFLGPFLFGALMVLFVFSLIQLFFPLGKTSTMIYGCLGAIIFCGYIVYDTDNLIKRYTYDEYIWAAISLYLDILNLFMSLLTILTGADD
ncbi:Bax inhibitor 1-related protein [Cynara cardunculus var. scolymus]|uniref:Bax inhibitor 1-related protein n=1 Tax=Cynara cardunculus var. scolymus TaxID=59895 RepID=A0A124SCN6_CYNCS|nr:Bax inhibitor 1-related protein [Cynara cardunculus var. scolymus]